MYTPQSNSDRKTPICTVGVTISWISGARGKVGVASPVSRKQANRNASRRRQHQNGSSSHWLLQKLSSKREERYTLCGN